MSAPTDIIKNLVKDHKKELLCDCEEVCKTVDERLALAVKDALHVNNELLCRKLKDSFCSLLHLMNLKLPSYWYQLSLMVTQMKTVLYNELDLWIPEQEERCGSNWKKVPAGTDID